MDSRKRTFRDYIEVARSCTRLQLNATESEFLAFVQDFFTAMDSMPPFDMDRQAAVKYYEVLLEEAAANGFRSRRVGDIGKGKVKSGNQATAYQWMLLQPWITIDQVSICLMDDPLLSEFRRLADDTPRCFSRLGKSRFAMDMNELPSILIKNAIANL